MLCPLLMFLADFCSQGLVEMQSGRRAPYSTPTPPPHAHTEKDPTHSAQTFSGGGGGRKRRLLSKFTFSWLVSSFIRKVGSGCPAHGETSQV